MPPAGKFEITLQVLGRNLSVVIPPEDEALIRQAAQQIEARIKRFKEEYGLKDEAYLLLMCALDLVTEAQQEQRSALDEVARLNDQLSQTLEILSAAPLQVHPLHNAPKDVPVGG